jgi:hypothetical protein
MTKDEALRLAWEALHQIAEVSATDYEYQQWASDAITAIKAALEAKDEPVAWISPKELLVMRGNAYAGAKDWRVNLGLEPEEGDVGLYTTPPQRTWVGLTYEELSQIEGTHIGRSFANAIEAKLKEKNT